MTNDRRDDQRPGDPAVDQAWLEAARDQPSAQLDAAILAAARAATVRNRSVPTPPATRPWWTHWQPLAAAAGVAGLAFTIVQMLPREADVPSIPATEQAVERNLPGRSESTTLRNATPPSAAPREADGDHPESAKRASPAASPPRQPTAGAAARDAAGAMAEAEVSSEQRLRQVAPAPAAPGTAEDWARNIEALYQAGEQDAAASALQAFRDAFPDADQYLAESLQPWAASVNEASAKEPAGITP